MVKVKTLKTDIRAAKQKRMLWNYVLIEIPDDDYAQMMVDNCTKRIKYLKARRGELRDRDGRRIADVTRSQRLLTTPQGSVNH